MSANSLGRNEIMRGERRIAALFASGKSGFRHPVRYVWRPVETVSTEMMNDAGSGESEKCANSGPFSGSGSFGRLEGTRDAEKAVVRVLFSVPKKNFKRAVWRNLLKRRMREAYRLNKELLLGKLAAARLMEADNPIIAMQTAGTKHSSPASTEKAIRGVEIALIYSTKEPCDYKTIEHAIKRILAEVGERL